MNQARREVFYPAGVRALLPPQARERRAIESSIISKMERRGFEEIVLPFVDYVDAYPSPSGGLKRQTYRFTDREGDLLFIRSDFTPMVARALASSLHGAELPLGVYYRGDVVRLEPARLGRSRESFQIGAERIGDATGAADLSMLMLACEALASLLGGESLSVTLTDVSLLPLLLDSGQLSAAQRAAVRAASARRLEVAPEFFGDADRELLALLRSFAAGRLTLAELDRYEPTNPIARRLAHCGEKLSGLGIREVIFALDDEGPADYYTGLCFQVFRKGVSSAVATGGRYDRLYADFGADAPAVGFTLNIDVIEEGR